MKISILKSRIRQWTNNHPNWLLVAAVFACLILIYIATAYALLDTTKTPRNLQVNGVDAGYLSVSELQAKLNNNLEMAEISIKAEDTSFKTSPAKAGLKISETWAKDTVRSYTLVDILFWPWKTKPVALELETTEPKGQWADELEKLTDQPKNANYAYNNGELTVVEAKDGSGYDVSSVQIRAKEKLESSFEDILLEPKAATLSPEITTNEIKKLIPTISKHLQRKIIINYGGKTHTINDRQLNKLLSVVDIDGNVKLKYSDDFTATAQQIATEIRQPAVDKQIVTFTSGRASSTKVKGKPGYELASEVELAQQLKEHITTNNTDDISIDVALKELPFKTVTSNIDDTLINIYSYSVRVLGSVSADLATFKAQAQQTLDDPRGWAQIGAGFRQVSSGGSFTLYLASPSQVAAASSGCSAQWSCRVGSSVYINDDRWTGATTSWNNSGGGLRDYRHMVVNHEVGHFLRYGHKNCGGSGQLAPIMQQQSISLQGCKHNPWPLASEL